MGERQMDDWQGAQLGDLLQELRGGSRRELRAALRQFDWRTGDLRQLGWSMAQKGLDLGTAMVVFFNGNPERYNYLRKDKVPLDARDRCLVLDAIHRRIASGFYLPDPDRGVIDIFARILEWVERQENDRAQGRIGRWVFDPALFTPITLKAVQDDLDDAPEPMPKKKLLTPINAREVLQASDLHAPVKPRKAGLWRDLLGPLLG